MLTMYVIFFRFLPVQVETEVFDKIDDLVSKGYGDEEYRDMFHEMLVHL